MLGQFGRAKGPCLVTFFVIIRSSIFLSQIIFDAFYALACLRMKQVIYANRSTETQVDNSEAIIATLYERYGGMVMRRCTAILKDEALAMDAVHDVFVQLLLKQESLHMDGLSSLLYRIATNICFNLLRHQQVRDHYSDQYGTSQAETLNSESNVETQFINLDRINKVLNTFPERTREAALYHYVDGFTMDEIAKMMHMSNSNTRRLLRELRQIVTQTENAL